MTIAARLRPDGDKLDITWSAEGERLQAPSLPLPPAPPNGGATLGGPGSVKGVYDGFGLMIASSPPLYRLAERRAWKASLVLAEGFEDGALPPLSTAVGEVSAASGQLVLQPGASLTLAPDFSVSSSVVVEVDVEGDQAAAFLVFTDRENVPVFSISGTGNVVDPTGARFGSIDAAGGHIAFSLELKSGSLYMRGAGGKASFLVSSSVKRLVISLACLNIKGGGDTVFDKVLVRSSTS